MTEKPPTSTSSEAEPDTECADWMSGQSSVIHCGWVEKRGGGTFSTEWARRFFVLARNVTSSTAMVYYYTDIPKKALEVCKLFACFNINMILGVV
jgi:hypothetical protein